MLLKCLIAIQLKDAQKDSVCFLWSKNWKSSSKESSAAAWDASTCQPANAG